MAKGEINLTKLLEVLRYETKDLIIYLQEELRNHGYEIQTDGDQYIFGIPATINNPDHPRICLVAHMDTITRQGVDLRVHNNVITNLGHSGKGTVLGADDRAGVFAILELIEELPLKPLVIFTNYEETGASGVRAFCNKDLLAPYLDKVNMFIEPDRRGSHEYVYYSSTLPELVAKFIERYGFSKQIGSFSDVKVLTDKYRKPHVNLCIGYYSQHTPSEHLDVLECQNVITQMTRMFAANDIPDVTMTKEEVEGKPYTYYRGAWDDSGYSGYPRYQAPKKPTQKNFRGTFTSFEDYLAAREEFDARNKGGSVIPLNSKSGKEGQNQAQGTPTSTSWMTKQPDEWDSSDWATYEAFMNKMDAEAEALRNGDYLPATPVQVIEETKPQKSLEEYINEKTIELDGKLVSVKEYIASIQEALKEIPEGVVTR